jgi:hypothetical protein
VRQESVVTFVMTTGVGGMRRIIEFSTENLRGISICFMREQIWSILWILAQKVKRSPFRLAGVHFFNFQRPSRTIGNKQSRQRSTPERPFGGNAVVYLN